MKSILDPSFRYVNAANTDLRKTFERVRRELRQREAAGQFAATLERARQGNTEAATQAEIIDKP